MTENPFTQRPPVGGGRLGTSPGPTADAPPGAGPASGLLLVAIVYAGTAQGAFYAPHLRITEGLVVLAAAAGITATWAVARSPAGRGPALAAAAIVVSILVSGWASSRWAAAVEHSAFVVVLAVAALTVAGRSLAERRTIAAGLPAVGALMATAGWIGLAFHHAPWAAPAQGIWRAAGTITYANGLAALLVMTTLVALSADMAGTSARTRLLLWANVTGVLLTASRAGLLGLAVGLAVLIGLTGWRPVASSLGRVAPAIGVAVAGVLPSLPFGSPARPLTAAAALVAAALLVRIRLRWPTRPGGDTSRPATAAVVGIVVAVAGLVVWAGVSTGALDRLWEARLTLASADRGLEWEVALDDFAAHPLVGRGPASFDATELGPDGLTQRTIRFAHNEYLQVAAETGILGLLSLGAAGVLLAGALRRSAADRTLLALTVPAVAAFAVHSGLDFLWRIPVLPLMAAVLYGLALDDPASRGAPP